MKGSIVGRTHPVLVRAVLQEEAYSDRAQRVFYSSKCCCDQLIRRHWKLYPSRQAWRKC